VSDANNAVRTVRSVRGQVDDRTRQIAGKAQEAEFKQAAATLVTELTAPEESIYQVKNQSSQDPLNYPDQAEQQDRRAHRRRREHRGEADQAERRGVQHAERRARGRAQEGEDVARHDAAPR
jgi:hypothetical protein